MTNFSFDLVEAFSMIKYIFGKYLLIYTVMVTQIIVIALNFQTILNMLISLENIPILYIVLTFEPM